MKIAVALYLYHTDLWDEYKELIENIKYKIKLYLGLCINTNFSHILKDLSNLSWNYSLSFHENYGADIAPFLYQLKAISEPFFIKTHSKKSLWGYGNTNWRYDLNYLLKPSIVDRAIKTLSLPTIGMIGNKKYLLHNNDKSIHINKIKTLCNLLQLNYTKLKNSPFFAGSTFISKTNMFKQILLPQYSILESYLKNEKNKINEEHGTYTHSLERIFGYIVSHHNLKIGLYYND